MLVGEAAVQQCFQTFSEIFSQSILVKLYLKRNLSQVYISSVYLQRVSQTSLTLFRSELQLYSNRPADLQCKSMDYIIATLG